MASNSDRRVEMPEAAVRGQAHAVCPFESVPKPKSVALRAEVLPSPQPRVSPSSSPRQDLRVMAAFSTQKISFIVLQFREEETSKPE